MEKVILDTSLLSVLGGRDRLLEICDESGQTRGYYLPVVRRDSDLYRIAEAEISLDELQRRRGEPDGRTTAEVLRRLESL